MILPDYSDDEVALLTNALENLNSPSWRDRLCNRITVAVGSVFTGLATAAATVVSDVWWTSASLFGRVVRTLSPLGFGVSVGALLSCYPSRDVVRRLRIEAWRLGIPLYFLLTQLYLNTDDEDAQRWIIDTIMTLWGLQISTLVDAYVHHHFHNAVQDVTLPTTKRDSDQSASLPLLGGDKRFRLITDYTPKIRRIKLIFMGLLGSGMVVGSFFIENIYYSHSLLDFGSFVVAQSVAIPLWERVEKWGHGLEEEFEKSLQTSPTSIDPPKALKAFRTLKQFLRLGLPISIATCFFYPSPGTLAIGGGLHGINDEIERYPFTHRLITKIQYVKTQILEQGRVCRVIDTTWRVARIAIEIFGLGCFGYLVLRQGSVVDDVVISAFIGATFVGYGFTRWIDRVFEPLHSSPLMQTLFFRVMHSPELFGINPLYLYYYTVFSLTKIGSESAQGAISFAAWFAYGWSFGRGMAIYESERVEPESARISSWLLFSNWVAFLQELKGVIR